MLTQQYQALHSAIREYCLQFGIEATEQAVGGAFRDVASEGEKAAKAKAKAAKEAEGKAKAAAKAANT